MLSFMDAFSGYHQISMHPPDAEKTSFITPHGLYCYNVMPFGLKNVRATYQRLVTKMFLPLLGSTMEVCKTRENSNFLKNGKTVISVKIQNFSISRMIKQTSPLESSHEI